MTKSDHFPCDKPETYGRETPDAVKTYSICKIDSCFFSYTQKGDKGDKGTKGQTCFEKGTKAKRKISNNIYLIDLTEQLNIPNDGMMD